MSPRITTDGLDLAQWKTRALGAEAREAQLRPHLRHIDACLYDGWERPCTCGLVKILAAPTDQRVAEESSRSLNEIEPWLQHHGGCGIRIDVGHESPCTCGLTAAVEQARQRP